MMTRRFLSSLVLLVLLAIPSAAWFTGGGQYVGFNIGGGTGAAQLLLGEADGLAIDFIDRSALVRDSTTSANNYIGIPFNLLSYPGASLKMTRQQDGVLRYGNHNLNKQSQTFDDVNWTSTRASFTANATTAPDGTSTADKMVEDGTVNNTHLTLSGNVVVSAGLRVRESVWAKAAGRSWLRLSDSVSANVGGHFDLTNGVTGTAQASNLSQTITSYGNGWYLCTIEFLTAGNSRFQIHLGEADNDITFSGDSTSGVYLWGAQFKVIPVEEPALLPGYIATTSASKFFLPYEWDTSGAPLGALMELGITNPVLQSQAFDNASWTKTSVTTTADSLTAPDGTMSADTVTASGANGTIQQNYTHSNNTADYASIYLERKTGTGAVTVEQAKNVTTPTLTGAWQRVEVVGTGSTGATYSLVSNVVTVTWTAHNLTTGDAVRADITSGTATDASVTSVTVTGANTFTFAQVAADTSGNVTIYPRTLRVKLATSGDEVYAWQAQAENFSAASSVQATSPIVTTTATVARAGDRFQIARASLPWSDTASTIYAAFYPVENALTYYITGWEIDSAATDYVALRHNTTTGNYFVSDENSIHVNSLSGGTLSVNAINKLIGAGATNDFAVSLNGAAVTTQASGGTMASGDDFTHFFVGNVLGTGSRQMQGYIRQVMWLPRRASNTELQNKSAP